MGDYAWPKPGIKLFQAGPLDMYNARVNYADDTWTLYAGGYRLAADELVRAACENRALLNELVYPIATLYRLYIELRLKEILRFTGISYKADHNLVKLWQGVRPELERAWPNKPEPLDVVEGLIQEFMAWDETFIRFRYPVVLDKSLGQEVPSISPGVDHINVLALGQAMEAFGNFLDSCTAGLKADAE